MIEKRKAPQTQGQKQSKDNKTKQVLLDEKSGNRRNGLQSIREVYDSNPKLIINWAHG